MRCKICGITRLEDAELAIYLGAWAVGFNFYPASPRYISPQAAYEIIQQLPPTVLTVGIVIGLDSVALASLIQVAGVDLLQIYSRVEGLDSFKKRMILALQVSEQEFLPAPEVLAQYGYLLLDAPLRADGLLGGTGRLANWALASQLAKTYRLILAGGLTAQRVAEAIRVVQPYAVDVATGVQNIPGKIDADLLSHFFKASTL
jgi:phosphoribosylanthranilate isomerase